MRGDARVNTTGRRAIVDLQYVRRPSTPPPPTPVPPPMVAGRKAWPGGKLVSNKRQALYKFLKRKQDNGEQLTDAQLHTLAAIVRENSTGSSSSSGGGSSSSGSTRNFSKQDINGPLLLNQLAAKAGIVEVAGLSSSDSYSDEGFEVEMVAWDARPKPRLTKPRAFAAKTSAASKKVLKKINFKKGKYAPKQRNRGGRAQRGNKGLAPASRAAATVDDLEAQLSNGLKAQR
ncbi:hypothetical protein JKP88DRAFT_351846 [Tribonema minus]|uniref:Uncharacterized protein n=1 Tax=Tribonema minus TaxID=303371 RepID=A0A836CN04_9STRA|nr:hypothetical protein JKP88DRAFT_351846 [Tribonema minus]